MTWGNAHCRIISSVGMGVDVGVAHHCTSIRLGFDVGVVEALYKYEISVRGTSFFPSVVSVELESSVGAPRKKYKYTYEYK